MKPPIRRSTPMTVLLLAFLHPAGLRSEQPREETARGDSTHAAFEAAEEEARRTPESYGAHWKAAALGAELATSYGQLGEAGDVLERAVALARRSTGLRPDGTEGHYWLAVTSGLLAESVEGRRRIALAEEAWKEAEWVLGVDSLHAGAHHIVGRLHAAVMRLSWLERTLAHRLLGADVIGEASWDSAVLHLRRAAELSPLEPVHHLELGLAYRDMDRDEEAATSFARAAGAPGERVLDRRCRDRAARLLEERPG